MSKTSGRVARKASSIAKGMAGVLDMGTGLAKYRRSLVGGLILSRSAARERAASVLTQSDSKSPHKR